MPSPTITPLADADADALRSASVRQGMVIVSVERHGARGKDVRVSTVARALA